MQNLSSLKPGNRILTKGSRLVRLLLVLVPLVLLLTVVPWPGNGKQAHAATISCPATIQYGSNNSTVTLLQASLNLIDPNIFKLADDGQFGSLTQAAVITFQKAANIQDNGQVGPQTWSELGQCKSSGGISGGGCTTANGLEACISWSSGDVIADGYAHASNLNVVDLGAAAYGSVAYDCEGFATPPNGYHFTSSLCHFVVDSQYGYVSYLEGDTTTGTELLAVSPVQWA